MANAIDPISQMEEDSKFINKLYDSTLDKQKQSLSDNYTQNTGSLDTEKQNVQQQSDAYRDRTNVEAEKDSQNLPISNLSAGGQSQAALTLGNQLKKDATTLNNAQAQADAEIERQRQLLASEYEAAIKEAQANNDMQRAQQLYELAKQEEARLRGYQQEAGNALAAKGDYSIVQNLYDLSDAQTQALQSLYAAPESTEAYTTPEALAADEAALRKIYDASLEAKNAQLQTEYDRSLSDLQAKQQTQQRKTDESLTKTYVDSLKQGKNYNEVQNAYGLGSGAKVQAALAREAGLQDDLTELRKLQTGYDAQSGRDTSDLLKSLLASRQSAQETADKTYNDSLYSAYNDQKEQSLADQEAAGKLLAKDKNDYSILGKLWGLTQDQIDRLQGTGAYAPQEETYYSAPTSSQKNNSSTHSLYRKDPINETYLGQGQVSTKNITFSDVVDGATKTAQQGGNVDDYITAAREGGYITNDQARSLKNSIKNLV